MNRSQTMAAVKSSGTGPERQVAELLVAANVRFKRNVTSLPGTPDFVIEGAGVALFVHGCWWHGHICRRGARVPKTNRAYWTAKVARNRRRDLRVARQLRVEGYSVWTIWECQLKRSELPTRLMRFLNARLSDALASG